MASANTNISTLSSQENRFDTFQPVTPDEGILPSAHSVSPNYNNPNHIYHKRYKLNQTAGGSLFDGMPSTLYNKTCILFRSVLYSGASHIVIKLEEAYPVCGRVWYDFYNIDHWNGWKSITPS